MEPLDPELTVMSHHSSDHNTLVPDRSSTKDQIHKWVHDQAWLWLVAFLTSVSSYKISKWIFMYSYTLQDISAELATVGTDAWRGVRMSWSKVFENVCITLPKRGKKPSRTLLILLRCTCCNYDASRVTTSLHLSRTSWITSNWPGEHLCQNANVRYRMQR